MARPPGNPLKADRGGGEPPEGDFGATVRYMALIFGGIALLALLVGWLLTR
jgi:hypothetical protein